MSCAQCHRTIRRNARAGRVLVVDGPAGRAIVDLHWNCAKWALKAGEYPNAIAVYRLRTTEAIDVAADPPPSAKAFATRMKTNGFKGTPQPLSGMGGSAYKDGY